MLHLVLRFPARYPSCPPSVEVCTPLPHPNVFPKTRLVRGAGAQRHERFYELCIDMLGNCSTLWDAGNQHFGPGQEHTLEAAQPYTGWSSAYSVRSLLVQLQVLDRRVDELIVVSEPLHLDAISFV